MNKKILIGGQALLHYGSSRGTDDIDYLINDTSTDKTFLKIFDVGDLINASGHKFFSEIWELEKDNDIATPQSLLELKAFALVQHCLNRNFKKADEAEFDIQFLCRTFGLRKTNIVNKYITYGQLSEINKIIKSI